MPKENEKTMERRAPRMHGPGPRASGEKAKNFKLAIKKLIFKLQKYWAGIILAFILAGVGSILTIMAPDKLSDLTDELTKGLVPKTEVLNTLASRITQNANEENMALIFANVLELNNEKINRILTSSEISKEEKEAFQYFLSNLKSGSYEGFNMLSASIKESLFSSTTYNGVEVSSEDKITLLEVLETTSKDNFEITSLPDSIKSILFPSFDYEETLITTEDQINFINSLSKLEDKENTEVLLQAMDNLPSSIYELVKPTMDFSKIKQIVLVIALLYGFNSLFGFIEGLIMVHVTNNYSRGIRDNISKKINRLPLKYFDNHTIGDILSRVTNDVDIVSQNMNQSFTTLVSAITLLVGSLIMMFYTNALMAITAVISSLFGFIFMFIILGKSQKYFMARQVELGNLNGHIEEMFSGHQVVKLYNGEQQANEAFDELNEKVYTCERKSQFLSGLMHPFMSFIGNFGYVCVCIVGALLTLNGNISFGVIVAFMMYIRLFTNPLTQIAQSMSSMQSIAAASERVFEFLDQAEMEDESHKKEYLDPKKVKGEITFDHVKFGYNEDKVVIKDFSAHILPGQKIAIVGPTGAGKTTLVNLLMRFYEITSGEIKIDGVSTKALTRENIHKLFIMVLQDTWLFGGTIRENIAYNKKNVSDEEIKSVCKTVGIEHYIKTLPNGLDSIVEDVSSISSGQKQLLTIARGMIEDAPFLILDEATSNVDTRTEELVQKAMDKLTVGRTSFIIAHRLSTIKNADLILVMNEGNIIETGSHEDLMKQNGFYANLYNSQFEKIDTEE